MPGGVLPAGAARRASLTMLGDGSQTTGPGPKLEWMRRATPSVPGEVLTVVAREA